MTNQVQFKEYIESKSVTTATTDNNAKRSERNHCLQQKCEETVTKLWLNQANNGAVNNRWTAKWTKVENFTLILRQKSGRQINCGNLCQNKSPPRQIFGIWNDNGTRGRTLHKLFNDTSFDRIARQNLSFNFTLIYVEIVCRRKFCSCLVPKYFLWLSKNYLPETFTSKDMTHENLQSPSCIRVTDSQKITFLPDVEMLHYCKFLVKIWNKN